MEWKSSIDGYCSLMGPSLAVFSSTYFFIYFLRGGFDGGVGSDIT